MFSAWKNLIQPTAVDSIVIPVDSNRNLDALLSISDQYTNLVVPKRAVTALQENIQHLIATLPEVGGHSIFQKLMAEPQSLTMVGEIKYHSPADRYEEELLFDLLYESSAAQTTTVQNALILDNSSFCIAAVRDPIIAETTEIYLRVEDSDKYLSFLEKLEERDQALQAGRLFANTLRCINDNGELDPKGHDYVELGNYTFQGAAGPAAAAAFLARNIPQSTNELPLQSGNDLKSIVSFLPSRRVTELPCGSGYEIYADLLSYRLLMSSQGDIQLSARLHPRQLARDAKLWFSSSAVAQELTSILVVTGVASALPKLAMHANEIQTEVRWGNGYASLSRMLCGMISGSCERSQDKQALAKLDDLFQGKLAGHLIKFRHMSSSTATQLVLDLLIGALGKGSPDQSLPVFNGPTDENSQTVNSCDDAEGYFVSSVQYRNYSTDAHFLYKKTGEPTALTRVPVVINGTIIPKGTLCLVHKDADTIHWAKPIRLTLFNLPFDGEGAEVFQHHLYKLNGFGQSDDDVRAVYRALDQ